MYKKLLSGRNLTSVYFGGGTPSLMPAHSISSIISAIGDSCHNIEHSEITIEANPGTVSDEKLREYKALGINRISLGVQSLNKENLKFLGRAHSVDDSLNAIELIQKHFNNYNLDYIYGLPGQKIKDWETELNIITDMGAPHLSMYQLTIEEGTPFFGRKYELNDNIAYAFYATTVDKLVDVGYSHYEVSNFAKPGAESRHNLTYWNYDDFIGIGPSASGRITINGVKHETKESTNLEEFAKSPIKFTPLTRSEAEEEALIMGLRTSTGVKIEKIQGLYDANMEKFLEYKDAGMLEIKANRVRATEEGLVKLDSIIRDLV